MKEKPIKTCTGLNCPERICSECQVGRSIKSTGEYTSQFICNNCQESFVGNPCTAGEKNWKELDEITETINNTKYVEAKLVKELLKEKCCLGGCGDINCEHCGEETIMDKSLRHYNFIQAKKKEDILANIEWSKSPPIPIPPHAPERSRFIKSLKRLLG